MLYKDPGVTVQVKAGVRTLIFKVNLHPNLILM